MVERTHLKVCPSQIKYIFYNYLWDITKKVSDGDTFVSNNSPKEAFDSSNRLHYIKKKKNVLIQAKYE